VGSAARITDFESILTHIAPYTIIAYKLKRWLTIRNSSNSSYDSLPSENWCESEKTDSRSFSIQFKNQKHDIFHNIEAWRKNIVTKKSDQNENKREKKRSSKNFPR